MSALARYFHKYNSIISGSDKEYSSTINDLQSEGIKNIWVPHNKSNIEKINPEYIIYSTAVTSDNEELIWAKEHKKVILHRSDLLEVAINSKKLIAISGTHGKTSTTAMVLEMLIRSNLEPSCILGGILESKNTNVIVGKGDYFLVEADESDKSFLKGNPEIGVITNIEPDHLENYKGSFEEIKKSFVIFAAKSLSKKGLVVCFQDKNTKEVIARNFDLKNPKLITYAIDPNPGFATVTAKPNTNSNLWDVYVQEKYLTSFSLSKPGEHNILNALATFSVGHLLGLNPEIIKIALENYKGVKRRFQIISKDKETTIIDDYAHHPTEIASTIKAAKELKPKRLIIVLQPHQPSRLKDLWNEFINVLKKEDSIVFITDTYIARGSSIPGVNSQKLACEVSKQNIKYLPGNIDQIAKELKKVIKEGDLILIMGAGDITCLGPKLLKKHETLASKFGNN